MLSFELHLAIRGICNRGPKVSIYVTIVTAEYGFCRSSFSSTIRIPHLLCGRGICSNLVYLLLIYLEPTLTLYHR